MKETDRDSKGFGSCGIVKFWYVIVIMIKLKIMFFFLIFLIIKKSCIVTVIGIHIFSHRKYILLYQSCNYSMKNCCVCEYEDSNSICTGSVASKKTQNFKLKKILFLFKRLIGLIHLDKFLDLLSGPFLLSVFIFIELEFYFKILLNHNG